MHIQTCDFWNAFFLAVPVGKLGAPVSICDSCLLWWGGKKCFHEQIFRFSIRMELWLIALQPFPLNETNKTHSKDLWWVIVLVGEAEAISQQFYWVPSVSSAQGLARSMAERSAYLSECQLHRVCLCLNINSFVSTIQGCTPFLHTSLPSCLRSLYRASKSFLQLWLPQ